MVFLLDSKCLHCASFYLCPKGKTRLMRQTAQKSQISHLELGRVGFSTYDVEVNTV